MVIFFYQSGDDLIPKSNLSCVVCQTTLNVSSNFKEATGNIICTMMMLQEKYNSHSSLFYEIFQIAYYNFSRDMIYFQAIRIILWTPCMQFNEFTWFHDFR